MTRECKLRLRDEIERRALDLGLGRNKAGETTRIRSEFHWVCFVRKFQVAQSLSRRAFSVTSAPAEVGTGTALQVVFRGGKKRETKNNIPHDRLYTYYGRPAGNG